MAMFTADSSGAVQSGVITPQNAQNVIADTLQVVLPSGNGTPDTLCLGALNPNYIKQVAENDRNGNSLVSALPVKNVEDLKIGNEDAPRLIALTDTTRAIKLMEMFNALFDYSKNKDTYGDRIASFKGVLPKYLVGALGRMREKRTTLGGFKEGEDYIVNTGSNGKKEILFLPGATVPIGCASQNTNALIRYIASIPTNIDTVTVMTSETDTLYISQQTDAKVTKTNDGASKFPRAFVIGGGLSGYSEKTARGTNFKGVGPSGIVKAYLPGNVLAALSAENLKGDAKSISRNDKPRKGNFNNKEVSAELMKYFGNPFGNGAYLGFGAGVSFGTHNTRRGTTSVRRVEFTPEGEAQFGYNFPVWKNLRIGPKVSGEIGKTYGNETIYFMGRPVQREWMDDDNSQKNSQKYSGFITLMDMGTDGNLPSFEVDAGIVYAKDGTIYGPFKETKLECGATLYLPQAKKLVGATSGIYVNGSVGEQREPNGNLNGTKQVNAGLSLTF